MASTTAGGASALCHAMAPFDFLLRTTASGGGSGKSNSLSTQEELRCLEGVLRRDDELLRRFCDKHSVSLQPAATSPRPDGGIGSAAVVVAVAVAAVADDGQDSRSRDAALLPPGLLSGGTGPAFEEWLTSARDTVGRAEGVPLRRVFDAYCRGLPPCGLLDRSALGTRRPTPRAGGGVSSSSSDGSGGADAGADDGARQGTSSGGSSSSSSSSATTRRSADTCIAFPTPAEVKSRQRAHLRGGDGGAAAMGDCRRHFAAAAAHALAWKRAGLLALGAARTGGDGDSGGGSSRREGENCDVKLVVHTSSGGQGTDDEGTAASVAATAGPAAAAASVVSGATDFAWHAAYVRQVFRSALHDRIASVNDHVAETLRRTVAATARGKQQQQPNAASATVAGPVVGAGRAALLAPWLQPALVPGRRVLYRPRRAEPGVWTVGEVVSVSRARVLVGAADRTSFDTLTKEHQYVVLPDREQDHDDDGNGTSGDDFDEDDTGAAAGGAAASSRNGRRRGHDRPTKEQGKLQQQQQQQQQHQQHQQHQQQHQHQQQQGSGNVNNVNGNDNDSHTLKKKPNKKRKSKHHKLRPGSAVVWCRRGSVGGRAIQGVFLGHVRGEGGRGGGAGATGGAREWLGRVWVRGAACDVALNTLYTLAGGGGGSDGGGGAGSSSPPSSSRPPSVSAAGKEAGPGSRRGPGPTALPATSVVSRWAVVEAFCVGVRATTSAYFRQLRDAAATTAPRGTASGSGRGDAVRAAAAAAAADNASAWPLSRPLCGALLALLRDTAALLGQAGVGHGGGGGADEASLARGKSAASAAGGGGGEGAGGGRGGGDTATPASSSVLGKDLAALVDVVRGFDLLQRTLAIPDAASDHRPQLARAARAVAGLLCDHVDAVAAASTSTTASEAASSAPYGSSGGSNVGGTGGDEKTRAGAAAGALSWGALVGLAGLAGAGGSGGCGNSGSSGDSGTASSSGAVPAGEAHDDHDEAAVGEGERERPGRALRWALRDALAGAAVKAFVCDFERVTLAGLAQAHWGDCKEYFKEQRPTAEVLAWHTQCRSLWWRLLGPSAAGLLPPTAGGLAEGDDAHPALGRCSHSCGTATCAVHTVLAALRGTVAGLARLYLAVKPARARVRQYWLDVAYIVAAVRSLAAAAAAATAAEGGGGGTSGGARASTRRVGCAGLGRLRVRTLLRDLDDYCVALLAGMAIVCGPADVVAAALVSPCCGSGSGGSDGGAAAAGAVDGGGGGGAGAVALSHFDALLQIPARTEPGQGQWGAQRQGQDQGQGGGGRPGAGRGDDSGSGGSSSSSPPPLFHPARVFADVGRAVESRRADQWKKRAHHNFFKLSWPWADFVRGGACGHGRARQHKQQRRGSGGGGESVSDYDSSDYDDSGGRGSHDDGCGDAARQHHRALGGAQDAGASAVGTGAHRQVVVAVREPLLDPTQRLALVRARAEFNSWSYSGVEYPPISCAHVTAAMSLAEAVARNKPLAAQSEAEAGRGTSGDVWAAGSATGGSAAPPSSSTATSGPTVGAAVGSGNGNGNGPGLTAALAAALPEYRASLEALRAAKASTDVDAPNHKQAAKELDRKIQALWERLCTFLADQGVLA